VFFRGTKEGPVNRRQAFAMELRSGNLRLGENWDLAFRVNIGVTASLATNKKFGHGYFNVCFVRPGSKGRTGSTSHHRFHLDMKASYGGFFTCSLRGEGQYDNGGGRGWGPFTGTTGRGLKKGQGSRLSPKVRPPADADGWYRVRMRKREKRLSVMVNDEQVTDCPLPKAAETLVNQSPVAIGVGYGGDLKGIRLDEIIYQPRPASSPPEAKADSGSGLIGHWKFDEGQGTVARDASGHGNDGVFKGKPKWVKGVIGGALLLDPSDGDDYVVLPSRPALKDVQAGSFTLAAWFRPLSTPKGNTNTQTFGILAKNGNHIGLAYRADGFSMDYWLAGRKACFARVSGAFGPSRFYHLAARVDREKGTVSLFVDAKPMQTRTFPIETPVWNYGSNPWQIGIARPNGRAHRWPAHGIVDDVRIYDRALPDEEIAALVSPAKRDAP
jgi:hypothetical protein